MLRCGLSLCLVLTFGSAVHGAALVSLVPTPPGNGASYGPGEQVRVDFFVQLDAASPATIRTRLLQFDLSDSSPALGIIPIENHALAEIGPIPFWNFGGAAACAGDETQCGTNYFIDGGLMPVHILPKDILVIAYTGLMFSDDYQLILRQASPTLVGSLHVIMPPTAGDFVLDVLNADDTDINLGAALQYGFAMPWDPEWGELRADTGGIVMAGGDRPGTDEFGRVAFAVIPEPAALTLLGAGGLYLVLREKSRSWRNA